MSHGQLPKTVNPFKFAEQNVVLHGSLESKNLMRFREAVDEVDPLIWVDLEFQIDENRNRRISGAAQTKATLICQRCLQPVSYSLNTEFQLGVVTSEEKASLLPKSLDPLICAGEALNLGTMVEDELILSLPIIAHHEQCEITTEFKDPSDQEQPDRSTNPFSVLSTLKQK